MSIFTPDEVVLSQFATEIEAVPPRPHHSKLIEIANQLCSGCRFKHALYRGGWYRPGGVIAADGKVLAENLDVWARAELDDCDGDMQELVERHADSGLLVTRHTGRTHYFVSSYGSQPADFLQLEVEELQEVLDRHLIDTANPPEDFQELTEPLLPDVIDAQAVGAPRYRFRRLIDMRQILGKISTMNGRNAGLSRLIAEWQVSSAASRGHFSNHWLIGLREHLDRYRNPVVSISLISRHARELKSFQWNIGLSGVEMSAQLQAFDRAAGYTAAWYFHLVSGSLTPPKIAYALESDLEAGFNYLPDTEAALLKSWVSEPYSV